MKERIMLTTFDNPFNPFVDFKSWYMFDCEQGYNTCSRIARLIDEDSEMTGKEAEEERIRVIEFMLKYDLEGKYFKGTQKEIDKWLEMPKNKEKQQDNQ
jgi:hypothetical protein